MKTGAVVGVLACIAGTCRAQITYFISDLGDLPGGSSISIGNGINRAGNVVGGGPSVGDHAFLWHHINGLSDLGKLVGGVDISVSRDINDSNVVVGESGSLFGIRAFRWTASGGMFDLGDLPGGLTTSTAHGINNVGQIVGASAATTGTRAFLWDAVSGMTNLGDLTGGADSSTAYDINSSGHVVGYGTASTGVRGFRWTPAGLLNLGDLPGGLDSSVAYGINDAGTIVGLATAVTGQRAFRWTTAGMVNLGDLPGGANHSIAYDISGSGHIVGTSSTVGGNHAFRWDEQSGLLDLNEFIDPSTPGWVLLEARAINETGQITGSGLVNGLQHAFLATPKPEASQTADFIVVEGFHFSGEIASTHDSDDDKLAIFPDSLSQRAAVVLKSSTTWLNPIHIRIQFEGSAGRQGMAQVISARNYDTNQLEVADARIGPVSDSLVLAGLLRPGGAYVGPSGQLEAQIAWAPINDEDPTEDGWLHAIDLFEWQLSP